MFIVAIESKKNAEKKGGMAKAYLARLSAGPGGMVREFAGKEKALNTGNRRCFRMDAQAGDLFEARRWDWDGDRYVGGTTWFGIQADGSILELTRDEAARSALALKLANYAPPADLPAIARPTRIPPAGVFCRPLRESEQA